jgi:hypothetical protein
MSELALYHRNARLRAWRDYGVPVEARWAPRDEASATLHFSCARCFLGEENVHSWRVLREDIPLEEALADWEKEALLRLARRGCSHLAVLLGPEPAEVRAIWELELLYG